ncbi:MAG: hypothetical protein QXO70_03580 [Candidatus Pacearchaeota archaeon]
MWGRKKVANVIEPEEMETEERISETAALPSSKQAPKIMTDEKKLMARIVDGALMENGLYKFTFVSNMSMGEIGQEFEW